MLTTLLLIKQLNILKIKENMLNIRIRVTLKKTI